MNASEQVFHAVMARRGLTVIPHPGRFPLPELGTTYTPDFLCLETGCYYEVSASRQAYSLGRHKYEAFRAGYPALTLLVVDPDGDAYGARASVEIGAANGKTSVPVRLGPAHPAAVELGRRGGLAAWADLTPEQRAEEMRKRWKSRPRAKKRRTRKAAPG